MFEQYIIFLMYIFYPDKLVYCHSGIAIIHTVTRGCFKKSGLLLSRESFVFLVFQEGNQGYKLSPLQKSTQVVADWHEDLLHDIIHFLTFQITSNGTQVPLCKWEAVTAAREPWIQSEDYFFYSRFVSLLSLWICYYSVGFFWLEYKGL